MSTIQGSVGSVFFDYLAVFKTGKKGFFYVVGCINSLNTSGGTEKLYASKKTWGVLWRSKPF